MLSWLQIKSVNEPLISSGIVCVLQLINITNWELFYLISSILLNSFQICMQIFGTKRKKSFKTSLVKKFVKKPLTRH